MKKYIGILIICLLWLVSIFSITTTTKTDFTLNLSNYLAYGLLVILSILWFIRLKRINTIIGPVLLVGSVNIISFTYKSYGLTFGISIQGLELNTIGVPVISRSFSSFCLISCLVIMSFLYRNFLNFLNITDFFEA